MNEIKLSQSQLELLRLKKQLIENAICQFQEDWQRTINMIAMELGIPESEFSQWRLDGDKLIKEEKKQ